MERKKEEQQSKGEIETHHPGYLAAQDTHYVGYIKEVGKIYQQTFIDTYTKVAFAKLYDSKNALVAANMLNDQVVPFNQDQNVNLLRVLTDQGTEYCGTREHHGYQLICPLSTSTIPAPRLKVRRPMAFASGSTDDTGRVLRNRIQKEAI